jgi:hypothetical protein
MDAGQQRAAANAVKQNNNKIILGGAAAAVFGYYWYKKRQGDVYNVGDAAAKSGAAVGRGLESAGQNTGSSTAVQEGRGLQAKGK